MRQSWFRYAWIITGSRSLHADFPKMKNVSSLRLRGSQSKMFLTQIAKKQEKTGSSTNQWKWRGSCKTPKPENLENPHYKTRRMPSISSRLALCIVPIFFPFYFFYFFFIFKNFPFSIADQTAYGVSDQFPLPPFVCKKTKKNQVGKNFFFIINLHIMNNCCAFWLWIAVYPCCF